jgi:hypothetical protein
LLTIALCVLVAEATVRVFWSAGHPRQPRIHTFDSDVGLVHVPGHYQSPFVRCLDGRPNCDDVSVSFTVNSRGFRGDPFREPPGKPLIVVLGDSMIEAAQVDDDKTACYLLEQSLRRAFPDVEVRNLGITSAGLVHYYARWRKFAAAMRPDVLVVPVLGINDFRNCSTVLERYLAMQPHYTTSVEGRREVHFEPTPNRHSRLRRFVASLYEPLETVRLLRWMKEARSEDLGADGNAKFADFRIYEDPLAPQYADAVVIGQEFLERLIREAEAAGTAVIVAYLPWNGEAVDAQWDGYSVNYQQHEQGPRAYRRQPEQLVRSAAERGRGQFVSFPDYLKDLPTTELPTLWHVRTDSHLTERGNQTLAECLASVVTEVMKARQAKSPETEF